MCRQATATRRSSSRHSSPDACYMTCTPVWQTWETFLTHNRTPPYISSEPDVIHGPNSFLILATYGLSELFDGAGRMDMVTE